MSLFSQVAAKNTLPIYGYVFAGGIGSLLIVFLLRQSLPLNNHQARQYYQNIEITQEKIHKLEKDLLAVQLASSQVNSDFNSQLDAVNKAINELKKTPEFLPQKKQNILEKQPNSLQLDLAYQSQLITQLLDARAGFNKSCLQLPKLQNEIVDNQKILTVNVIADSEIFSLVDSLLDLSIHYCQSVEQQLETSIQNKAEKINILLEKENIVKNKFIITEVVNDSTNIIIQEQKSKYISQKIDFLDLTEQLKNLKIEYLNLYQNQLQKTNNYRLISSILILSIIIFVAYKIISNLMRTNRNIVKILEGFTKELETKVEERTAQLEKSIQNNEIALAQAQNANRAKSRFLANMSHELRTPLNAILGFTQLMTRDDSIGVDQQENLKIINRSGEHLLKLINDILEMSKIEVGQVTLNENQFDLHIMLRSIEEMLRLKAQAKKLNLSFNIAADVPRLIFTDEGKLRQIVINLLGNALKFTATGSVILTVRVEENTKLAEDNIDFLFSDTYSLYFAVEDTGPGIAPEEMTQLFTPFEQTRIGRISHEGTGLGLSICHKFVELMGENYRQKAL